MRVLDFSDFFLQLGENVKVETTILLHHYEWNLGTFLPPRNKAEIYGMGTIWLSKDYIRVKRVWVKKLLYQFLLITKEQSWLIFWIGVEH